MFDKTISVVLVEEDKTHLLSQIKKYIRLFIESPDEENAKFLRTYWEIYKATYL